MTTQEPHRPMDQQELRALETQCIQECAPPCTAACPIHVDVRAVLLDFGRGEDDAALRTLRRTLPFPGIIGRICDQPCRPVCTRGMVGEPIEIAALERACVDYAITRTEKVRPLPRRTQGVGVVGAGLAGLTAALDLARKGYAVTVYEALRPVGGRVWTVPEERLPRSVIVDDLAAVDRAGVSVRLDTRVGGDLTLALVREAHDAVFVAVGGRVEGSFGLATDATGRVAVDPVTYATDRDGVFAGGSMLREPGAWSPIGSIADGRRAAISIDRYLQGVSLTASREGEGSLASCLRTRTDGIAALPAVVPADPGHGHSPGEARREAQRCLQCECMECVKVCEYLEHYKRYPRKAIREIYNNLSIVKGSRYANRMINACSLCGLCAEVCPTDLDMGAVARQSRRTMVAQGRMPASAHDFALRDMAFSQGDQFAMARNAPGTTASDVVLFPGCQLSGASPERVEQVYDYLVEVLPPGTRVGMVLGCCGAPADWAGREDLHGAAIAGLRDTIASMGDPTVVLACSSCHRSFREAMPEVAITSLWEVMAARGIPTGGVAGDGRVVSIHDACSTRHETEIQDSVRTLLDGLGYEVAELPRSRATTTCCGYGGMQWLADPEVARKTVARRVDEGTADFVAYCAMCRDMFARGGKPTVHLLDLVLGGEFDLQAARPATGWSQRHENRARLKRHLLERIWGEPMEGSQADETLSLQIDDGVRARMEDRLILVNDVRRVIAGAEASGRRMALGDAGHLLASFRPTAVTYWVEYSVVPGGYAVHDAYSHRMEVAEVAPIAPIAPDAEVAPIAPDAEVAPIAPVAPVAPDAEVAPDQGRPA
jgi:NADPH-dependent glutamate synthase beta subunit-like oxidoreductase